MITLAIPVSSTHGWGICGKYLTRELAKLLAPPGANAPPGGRGVRLITDQLTPESVGDELEYQELAPLQLKPEQWRMLPTINGITQLNGSLLASIVDKQMGALFPMFRGTRTVGYTFFEENLLTPAWIDNARRNFDQVTTGSSWCTETLRQAGLSNVQTIIQGVDPNIFFPFETPHGTAREFLCDRFVVFSGGKFELRKAQDIVIRAYKVLQDRHPDVMLINAWYNPWPQTMESMRASPYIRLPATTGSHAQVINRILAENGVDVSRVLTLGPRANALLPRVYHNTDVGIFPNRCEGGTNLVLMEYLACGKPVVATVATGHADVVKAGHALAIGSRGESTVADARGPIARWPEPDVDQAIEQLEWAYQNRGQLRELGRRAATFMAGKTWKATAAEFLRVLTVT